ncbi:DUF7507 domain-containing protein [Coralloluteibacterium thermophilus]|uniref:DUF11 domain-containing protein n=1 Tax=Coralloluteibacterium thermophilum TaxID=2707049 RepID=A0ABV9NNI7_9GAMM
MRWLGALCALLFLVHGTAYAQLAERHSFNVRGDVEMIGNALLTCTSCDQSNSALSNGSTVPMRYVNVEGDLLPAGVPQNSSTATLSLPPGATVLSAGLYWGGRAPESNADRGTIHFRTPRGVYRPMVAAATNLHTFPSQGDPGSRPYTAYVDVTDLVAAAGAGTYAAGGLTSDITQNGGSLGNYGGWALIVLYEDAGKPYRRLMVFDGNAGYVNGSNPQSVTVSGLLTPVSGSFDAYMGALVWEGDGGISGDQFSLTGADVLNPGALSDALSPLNNFWNSGITRLGERFTDKNPDYVNQFAVDLKLVDISNTPTNAGRPRLRNGASGATLTFTSSQDAYFPHALVFVTDIFFPDLVTSLRKEARRMDGTPLGPDSTIRHGEEIEYVISFTNSGQDGATQVTVLDPIPANTTYVPNSLHIVSNAQDGFVGEPSDAVGDDVAEYDAAANRVVFRVGTGADAVQGGRLGQGESASMTFRVSVNADAAIGTPIRNDASVRHNAETVPLDYDVEGGAETNVVGPVLPVAEDIDFCPADGSVFNVVNGVGIYRYTPGAGADVRVGSLDFPVSGDLNALMVDASGPRNRLLFHAAGTGMVWAYDPTHPTSPGWYETGAVVNVNLPRAGMTPDGVGYMITSVTGPTDAPTAQMYRIERSGDYGYVVGAPTTLRYDVNPTDRGSGDIAFDDKGYGWLVAGSDLYKIDVDAGTATRQQSFTGAPSGANYAGAAFGDDGRLYVVVNATGAYYAMDLASGTMELVATSVGTGANNRGRDLASCSFPTIEPARLQVEKALASITRAGAAVPATEPAAPGDVLVYDIHVRHVGGNQAATVFPGDVTETVPANTSRTGATADDFACTGADCTNAEARNIASGQSATFRFSVRIDTDVPASVDRIDNSVSVAGVDCGAAGSDCTETTPLDVRPGLSSIKTLVAVDGAAPTGPVALGDVLTYSVVATNTGNVVLPTVVVADARIVPGSETCAALAPGAECVLTGTYTVTQADIDAGVVTNTATITTPDTPQTCPAGATDAACRPSFDVSTEAAAPALTVVKTAGSPSGDTAGSTVGYQFVVTNTGNVTLSGIAIDDDRLDAPATCAATTLAPGGTTTCTGTHTITQAEIDAGEVRNTATATGIAPGGGTVASPPDDADVGIDAAPALSLVKTAGTPSGNRAGSTVGYQFVVTNTGNVTLSGIAIDDDRLDAPATCAATTLAPGGTTTCTGTHTITQAEIDAGEVRNTATATGTAPGGGTVASPPDDADVAIARNPALATDKALTANADEDASGTVTLHDTLTYTVTATNTGTVTLANVEVRDDRIVPSSIVCASLAPGAACTLVGTYVVAQADVNAGQVLNTASIATDEPGVCAAGGTSAACNPSLTVAVIPYEIVATDDAFGPVNGADGAADVGNLLDNDTLDGVAATPATVSITVDTLPAGAPGIDVDTATGVVSVAPGTPAGTYTFAYTLCEVLNPTNCDTATVTVVVEAAAIVANDDAFGPVNGADGATGIGNLLDNDTLNGVTAVPGMVSIAPDALPAGIEVDAATGAVSVAPGTPAGTYTFAYTLCEVLNPTNCDTATVRIGAVREWWEESVDANKIKLVTITEDRSWRSNF